MKQHTDNRKLITIILLSLLAMVNPAAAVAATVVVVIKWVYAWGKQDASNESTKEDGS